MKYKVQKFINTITFRLTEMGPGFTFRDIWYNFKYGIKNLHRFFWVIWKWRPWAFDYNADLLSRGLSQYLRLSQKSTFKEEDKTRLPKEAAIKKVIDLISNLDELVYLEEAEKLLGKLTEREFEFEDIKDKPGFCRLIDNRTNEELAHDKKVYALSEKLIDNAWNNIWNTIKKDARVWWN